MADLDTASKRSSSMHLFGMVLALPLPDGTVAQADRQQSAGSYAGLMAAGGGGGVGTGSIGPLIGINRLVGV